MSNALAAIGRINPRADRRADGIYRVLPALLAAGLAVSYLLLLTWPMRIWHRPVGPHTHLVGTFGVQIEGAVIYTAIVLLLFALYALALAVVLTRRARPSPWLILGSSALFCLALWPTHPLTSNDIFSYIASARVFWVHGDNPLTVAPLAHPEDRFFALLTFWQDVPSPYGPIWSWLTGIPVALGGDSPLRTVLAFKGVSILFFLGAGALIFLTARRMREDSATAALIAFAWNPLVVWHVAGNGHNDMVMMFFVVLCLYALARGWVATAIVALTASALVKYATLLIVPLFVVWWLRSRRRPAPRRLILGVGIAMALVVVSYAPFWSGRDTLATALDEGSYYTVSIPAALRGALLHVTDVTRAEEITTALTRLLFLAALALILVRLRGDKLGRLAEAGFLAFFAYLVLAATYFSPWHVTWALTFAVLLPYRRDVLWPALTLSLTAMSVLVWGVWFRERFAPDPRADWYPMHLAAALAVFPLPVLVWLWTVRYPAGTPVRRRALQREAARAAGQ
jgi:alpha-1,6-mannosyltransferase